MKWFYNLKIGTKLLASFFLVAFIAGVIGVVGITSSKTADDRDTFMYEKQTVPLGDLIQITGRSSDR